MGVDSAEHDVAVAAAAAAVVAAVGDVWVVGVIVATAIGVVERVGITVDRT